METGDRSEESSRLEGFELGYGEGQETKEVNCPAHMRSGNDTMTSIDRKQLDALIDLARRHGWNNVNNPRSLSVFFEELIADLNKQVLGMKKVILGLLFGSILFADSVVQTTNVVATAGSATQVICTFSNPSPPSIHIVCTANGVTQTIDGQPPVGVANGTTGSITYSGNTVNWILQQQTAGTVTYQIAANAQNKSGTF